MNHRKTYNAFTLVELLVVVAIIALLLSILLPALGKARETAKIVVCGANLKQVGIAVEMYTGENELYYPPLSIRTKSNGSTSTMNSWLGKTGSPGTGYDQLTAAERYIKTNQDWSYDSQYNAVGSSYQCNASTFPFTHPDTGKDVYSLYQGKLASNGWAYSIKNSQVHLPSITVVKTAYGAYRSAWFAETVPKELQWHEEGISFNIVFADTHVTLTKVDPRNGQ